MNCNFDLKICIHKKMYIKIHKWHIKLNEMGIKSILTEYCKMWRELDNKKNRANEREGESHIQFPH